MRPGCDESGEGDFSAWVVGFAEVVLVAVGGTADSLSRGLSRRGLSLVLAGCFCLAGGSLTGEAFGFASLLVGFAGEALAVFERPGGGDEKSCFGCCGLGDSALGLGLPVGGAELFRVEVPGDELGGGELGCFDLEAGSDAGLGEVTFAAGGALGGGGAEGTEPVAGPPTESGLAGVLDAGELGTLGVGRAGAAGAGGLLLGSGGGELGAGVVGFGGCGTPAGGDGALAEPPGVLPLLLAGRGATPPPGGGGGAMICPLPEPAAGAPGAGGCGWAGC